MFDVPLTEENFMMYAMKCYDGVCLDVKDFYDDLNRIKYIKRLLSRYDNSGELKERLILNHIIMFTNVFGVKSGSQMLLFRLDEQFYSQIKTFLTHLNFMPEKFQSSSGEIIRDSDIPVDQIIAKTLRDSYGN